MKKKNPKTFLQNHEHVMIFTPKRQRLFFMLSDAHEKKYQMFGFRSVFIEITEESLDVKHAI